MDLPGLGPLTADDDWGGHRSTPVAVPLLSGLRCSVVLTGYDGDEEPEDFHGAVATFLAMDPEVLTASSQPVFDYYLDVRSELRDKHDVPEIGDPEDVWTYVEFPDTVHIDRAGDGRIYASLECECAWEPEHGLLLVFRDGRLTKAGPFDGHLTNDAADDGSEAPAYVRWNA